MKCACGYKIKTHKNGDPKRARHNEGEHHKRQVTYVEDSRWGVFPKDPKISLPGTFSTRIEAESYAMSKLISKLRPDEKLEDLYEFKKETFQRPVIRARVRKALEEIANRHCRKTNIGDPQVKR